MKAKVRIHPLESLAALLGILGLIGLGSTLLGGCTSDSGGSSAPAVDEKALKAKYEAEAEKQIDEKNADAVLGDLEKEIDSDAAQE